MARSCPLPGPGPSYSVIPVRAHTAPPNGGFSQSSGWGQGVQKAGPHSMATSLPQWPKSSFKRGEVSSRDRPHPYQAPPPPSLNKGHLPGQAALPSLAQENGADGLSAHQSAINSTLNLGPALEQVRAVPPPAPDLSAGDTGTQPWGARKTGSRALKSSVAKCSRTFCAGQKCYLQATPYPGPDPASHLPPHQAHPQREAASAPPMPLSSRPSEAHVPHTGSLRAHAPLALEERRASHMPGG